jgi:hypothetical protein
MEGTSGAADRAPLRGGAREAALEGERSRERRHAGRARGWHLARVRRRWRLQPAPSRPRDRRCPSGSGWGEAPTASDRGGREPNDGRKPAERPLTREFSVGCTSKGARPPATCRDFSSAPSEPRLQNRDRKGAGLCGADSEGAGLWGIGATTTLRTRATAGVVGGVQTVHGACSRIVVRLQKSTGGAWPIAATGEEPVNLTMGLALPRESSGG